MACRCSADPLHLAHLRRLAELNHGSLPTARRLQVYRNNLFESLADALAALIASATAPGTRCRSAPRAVRGSARSRPD